MATINVDATVGELVSESPGRSRVFEKYGIDYCCGGKKPLSEACAAKEISLDTILEDLAEWDTLQTGKHCDDFASMGLEELANHIVATHHAYVATEMPRLEAMAEKVEKAHGASDERLADLTTVVHALAAELAPHMMKEEQVLFPIIRKLAHSDTPLSSPCGSIANPIAAMEADHDNAGNNLKRMRRLTDDYTPPDWACNTYRALLEGLREFELDLHQHIHKENNILFPKALELERRTRQGS